ncbi:MAG: hypothetical protein KA369_08210 [Spirochaetes bacterium]|nr:hypothetical protein [Spirochaetota bacterium]
MTHKIIKFEPSAIEKFQKLTSGQWWEMFGRQGAHYYTINHDKYSGTLYNLVRLKRASEYVTGRFVAELIEQIQREVDEWNDKYYRDEKKTPEYTSARKWFDDHYEETRISWKQAGRYLWIYKNIDPEFSGLGYKKNYDINTILHDDKEMQRKFRELTRDNKLSETEVQDRLLAYIEELEEEAREEGVKGNVFNKDLKDRVFKKIENMADLKNKNSIAIKEISSAGAEVVIRCGKARDAERIRDVLISMEEQLKLKAYKKI